MLKYGVKSDLFGSAKGVLIVVSPPSLSSFLSLGNVCLKCIMETGKGICQLPAHFRVTLEFTHDEEMSE